MSGILVGNAFSGRAILNIGGIKREDARFYTCELYHIQSNKAMKLSVKWHFHSAVGFVDYSLLFLSLSL